MENKRKKNIKLWIGIAVTVVVIGYVLMNTLLHNTLKPIAVWSSNSLLRNFVSYEWKIGQTERDQFGGSNVKAKLSYENTSTVITITGEGKMMDFNEPFEKYGWRYFEDKPTEWSIYPTKVIIEEGITSIGANAFLDCSRISSITIPKSVKNIGDYAFANCMKMATVNYEGTMLEWSNINLGYRWNTNVTAMAIYCRDGSIHYELDSLPEEQNDVSQEMPEEIRATMQTSQVLMPEEEAYRNCWVHKKNTLVC